MDYTPGGYQQPPENGYSNNNGNDYFRDNINGYPVNNGNSYNGNSGNGYPGGGYPPFPGKKFPHFVAPVVWLREKRNIRILSMIAGGGIVLYIIFSSVIVSVLHGLGYAFDFLGILEYSKFSAVISSAEFLYLFQIIYSVLCVGGPFFLIGYIANKKSIVGRMPMGKPRNAKYLPIIVLGAFGICLLGNIITGYIDIIIESLTGFELKMPDMPDTPRNFTGIFLSILSTAVVPALVEEMAMRGIVMQPLRRYGDWFAILCSAMMFGLMHCNLVQIPFAFIAGVAIGYAVIVTESLWTGVIIHFCNNAFSVVVSMIYEFYGLESPIYQLCNIIFYGFIVLGVICVFIYLKKFNTVKMKKSPLINEGRDFYGQPHPLSAKVSNKKLFGTYVLTVPMIIAFIAVVYETVIALMYT